MDWTSLPAQVCRGGLCRQRSADIAALDCQPLLDLLAKQLALHSKKQLRNLGGDLPGPVPGPLVNGQPDEKIRAILVAIELRRRGAVGAHRPEDLGDPGGSPVRQIQLLEELPDAPVPVSAADSLAGTEVFHPDRAVRVRKAQHHDVFRGDAYFDPPPRL